MQIKSMNYPSGPGGLWARVAPQCTRALLPPISYDDILFYTDRVDDTYLGKLK